MIDALLVNSNNKVLSPFAGQEPPLWALLIAAEYRKRGQEVAVLDAEALNLSPEETMREIRGYVPKVVVLVVMGNNPSVSSTPKMVIAKKLAVMCDYEGYTVYFAGLHPTVTMMSAIKDETNGRVMAGKPFDGTPDIPYDLVDMSKYIAHNWHCLDGSPRQPYVVTYSSLGCAFNCDFCNISALYGAHKVYYRDINAMFKEIDMLVGKYHVRNIKMWDEMFTLNTERVVLLCERLAEKHYDLNIWAYARVDSVSPRMLEIMKLAGIKWLAYGFESGSDRILEASHKKADKQKAIRAVKMTQNAGINIIGNFIFGLPEDTTETMQETLAFAKSLKLDWVNFYHAEALPGSKLYDGENRDWSTFGQYSPNAPRTVATEYTSKAFIDFFTDESYLKRTEQKFGLQAVEMIDKMLAFGKPQTVNYETTQIENQAR